jgi:hypothetical protein
MLFSTFLITLLTSVVVSFPQRICFLSDCYNGRSTTSSSTMRRQRTHTGSTSSTTTAIRMEALESIGKILSDTFRFPSIHQKSSTSEDVKLKRNDLKQDLLQVCRQLPTSSSWTTPTIRLKVEEIMKQLSPLSPVVNTAKSPLLQKEWLLLVLLRFSPFICTYYYYCVITKSYKIVPCRFRFYLSFFDTMLQSVDN